MSLIWRLGVTSIEPFAGADLGPHHEHLRSLLLAADPADFLRYPAMATALTYERRHIPDLTRTPQKSCGPDSFSRMETYRWEGKPLPLVGPPITDQKV